MIVIILQAAVILLGAIICLFCAAGIYSPARLTEIVQSTWKKSLTFYFAIGFRLLLGAILIVIAGDARFPLIFQILGWIAIVAAITLLFVGPEPVGRMIDWFEKLSPVVIRLWSICGLAFGGFLIYGVT